MINKYPLLLLLFVISLPLAAEFRTIAIAHEISPGNFQAPASANASVSFRICDTCDNQSSRVTAKTNYLINNQSVTLKEFRDEIRTIVDRKNSTIIVKQHLESNTVVYVSVTTSS